MVYLAGQPWHGHHSNRGDTTLLQGIGKDSVQLYLDAVRRKQAQLSSEEQDTMVFGSGELVEWDECGLRAERVSCARNCSECDHCVGYRLLWNRWIIGAVRGDRTRMVVKQLPWRTSEAGGGGVTLNGEDCDAACLPHLGSGVINLTDRASAYEAFAGGLIIVCCKDCDRKDCLARAAAEGKTACKGERPRAGRARYASYYKNLRLSHGVVSHKKEESAIVKAVRVFTLASSSRMVKLKHGTEVADGAWAEVTSSYPKGLHSRDHDRIAEYINSWAWRARRHGLDLFRCMGDSIRNRV